MVFISCRKNDPDTKPVTDNPPVEKEKTCVPASLKWRDSIIYKFHTNDLNQITEITAHSFAAYRGNTKIKYDDKGRVIEVEFRIKHGQTSTFHKYYYGESEQPQYRITFYENKKSVIDSFYYDSTKNLIEIQSYIIKDKARNIYKADEKKEYIWYNNSTELKTESHGGFLVAFWRFSNIKNPFHTFNQYFNYLYFFKIKSFQYLPSYSHELGPNATDQLETKYSYECNDLGYPVTIKRQLQSPDSSSTTFHIDYICK